MRLFARGCESRQAAYLVRAAGLGARERMALETHAMTCSECADALRNGRPVDTALRGAFASLRERRTIIAPGRVRLAVGLTRTTPSRWLLAPRLFGRLTEVSVMLAVTVFAVGSSLEPSTQPSSLTPPYSVVQEYFLHQRPPLDEIDSFRWPRLVRPDVSATVSDAPRLPSGGRFDSDPIEILKTPSGSPR
jgi:anti-sigma factor RsiW